jgi:hypothetical protein
MSDCYQLDGHDVVKVAVHDWRLESADQRRVAADEIGDARVSTVFLGLDHGYGDGPPLIFETMIFGGQHDAYQERYSTWQEAEAGHKRAVVMVKQEAWPASPDA